MNIIPNPMKVAVPNLVKDIEKENWVLTFASTSLWSLSAQKSN
jgi:hypothetical protein